MIYDNFEIHAFPSITKAYCTKCGTKLIEMPDGWFKKVFACPKCKIVYTLKLVKIPDKKIDRKLFLKLLNKKSSKKA